MKSIGRIFMVLMIPFLGLFAVVFYATFLVFMLVALFLKGVFYGYKETTNAFTFRRSDTKL